MTTRNYQKSGFTHQNFSKKNLGGFTLIETLVAIAILLIAIIGPISLIGDSLHKIYYAKDEMIALNLAQEGIEVVRQSRDTAMLTGFATFSSGTLNFVIDAGKIGTGPVAALVACAPGCDQKVYFDAATGLYRQGATFGPTQFSRIVTMTDSGLGADERKVTSTVGWRTGGGTGTISTSEYIFKTF